MTARPSLGAHIRAGLSAALMLALCQVVIETSLIAVYGGRYLLSPSLFLGGQPYDFCVKLILLLPGGGEWFRGGALDTFLGAGWSPKLAIGTALLGPNLVGAVVLGVLVGSLRWLMGARAEVLPALVALVALAFAIHVTSWFLAMHVPRNWSARVLVRQAGRVFVWQGAWLSFLALSLAALLAGILSLLRPAARWAVSGALVAILGVSLLALAPTNAGSSVTAPATASAPPTARRVDNLILISIDSLRADRLGSYGGPHDTSPTIDRLAHGGVRYDNASSSSSWTLPSHMSMLTGRDALAHGVISLSDSLSPSIPTLAEELEKAQFATAGIVSTPVLNSRFGFHHGFDHYDDKTIPSPNTFDAVADEPAPQVEKLATEWLRQHAGERFFLFLHFWDVHYDYIPPPPYDTMFDANYQGTITGKGFFSDKAINKNLPQRDVEHLLALYDGEIRWVDDHIARILGAVEELGLTGKTAVIITSDHGDEFFEHGFKGHGRTLYEEVTRIPLVISVAGAAPGQVIDEPVSLVDLMPTALSLLGVDAPPGVSGVDVFPGGDAHQLAERAGVLGWLCSLTHRSDCQAMQKNASGTLIHRFQPQRVEFYSAQDEAQKTNLADQAAWAREPHLSSLQKQLNGSWQSYRKMDDVGSGLELDAATRDRLRDLGYIN